VAEQPGRPLSEWLELMLGEITRRQEEAQAGDVEQAARAAEPTPPGAFDEPPMLPASVHAPSRAAAHTPTSHAQSRPAAASRARRTRRVPDA